MTNQAQEIGVVVPPGAEHGAPAARLFGRSLATFGLMVGGTGLSLLIALFLARMLGAAGYGAFTYARTWISVLGVATVLGMEVLIIRNVAAYQASADWGLMRGLVRRANQLALLASATLACGAGAVSLAVATGSNREMVEVFCVSLLLLPLLALVRIRQATLQGLHYVVSGQIPAMLGQPILFIGLISVVFLWSDVGLTASRAMVLSVCAVGVVLVILTWMARSLLPRAVRAAPHAYQTSLWVRSALPLLFVNSVYIVHSGTDTLMLGAIQGAESVGAYAIAKRGAGLITFIAMAVNSVLAPIVSQLYSTGQIGQLQSLVTRSIRWTLLASLPFASVLVVCREWFLGLFGPEFAQGGLALLILSTGHLLNTALGSVALLLIMTGNERDAAIGVGMSATLNVLLNALLIPVWSLNGAAAATIASLLPLNVFLAVRVYQRIGVHPTVLGRLSAGVRR